MTRLHSGHLEALAEARGLKRTRQRRAIDRRLPMTSRATVYNTVALLKEAGLVHEVFEDGVARIDPNLAGHHHFVCRRCGLVSDVDWETVPGLNTIAVPGGEEIESFTVTFRGLCAKCRRGKPSSGSGSGENLPKRGQR